MALGLLESSWPRPVAAGIERARGWHLRELTGWLTRAGAEPRLALIICAGEGARDALLDACVDANVDVAPAPVSAARPIAPALMAHRGDHFNSTLFLIERLAAAPDAVFETLNGLRGQLRRMATWVGLVIEDLATLDRLQRLAPGLLLSVQRAALVLGAGPGAGLVSPMSLAAWRKHGQIASLAFAAATSEAPPDYDGLSRLIRAGYGDLLADGDPMRRQVHALWRDPSAPVEPTLPAIADAALRHGAGVDPVRCGAHASDAALIATGHAAAPTTGAGTDRRQLALLTAAARAEAGDLDGCMAALTAAEPPADGPMPELAVEVLEKRIALLTFTGDRAGAKAALDRLDAQVDRLASPGYRARAIVARARFVEPLDPTRARLDLLEAERLFRAHGYPQRASALMEAIG